VTVCIYILKTLYTGDPIKKFVVASLGGY